MTTVVSYAALTRTPADAGMDLAAVGPQPPLPALIVPASEPDVDPAIAVTPSDDPLVEVTPSSRCILLEAYRTTGWPDARPGAYLRRSVADRLERVAAGLPPRFGLAVFDAWRPLELQAALYEAAYGQRGLPPGFVAAPCAEPRTPPPHLTGATVDLTLTFDGHALALGTAFDEFTPAAHTAHLEAAPGAERELRRLLYHAMRAQGFVVLECEWWHFEIGTRAWAAMTGEPPRFGPVFRE